MRRKLLPLQAAHLARDRMYRAWVLSGRMKGSTQAHGMAPPWRIRHCFAGPHPIQRGTHRYQRQPEIANNIVRRAKGRMITVATRHNQASRRLCVLVAPMHYLCVLMPRFRRMTTKIIHLDLKSLHQHRLSMVQTLYTYGLIVHG